MKQGNRHTAVDQITFNKIGNSDESAWSESVGRASGT